MWKCRDACISLEIRLNILKPTAMIQNIFERISIPKPCHEDWSQMTPDEKGAFCQVCNKSVHDFSRKSAEEVEQILLQEEPGKVCGRFSSKQLSIPENLEIPFHLIPRNLAPARAFALAVFLVFGTALFGLTAMSGQHVAGKVCIRRPAPDTSARITESRLTMGGIKRREEPPVVEHMVKGDTMYSPPDTAKVPMVLMTTPSVPPPPDTMAVKEVIEEGIREEAFESFSLGSPVVQTPLVISVPEIPDTMPVITECSPVAVLPQSDTVQKHPLVQPDTAAVKEQGMTAALEDPSLQAPPVGILCFPNPSTGPLTLHYTVTSRTNVSALVSDLQGKTVRSLFEVKGHYTGNYSVGVDLSDLPNGTYLIRVLIGENQLTTRVVLAH